MSYFFTGIDSFTEGLATEEFWKKHLEKIRELGLQLKKQLQVLYYRLGLEHVLLWDFRRLYLQ